MNIPSAVVWSGDEERCAAQRIREKSAGHAILAPRTNLRELAAFGRLAKLDGGLRGIDAKLGNEAFLAKADPDVVASERDRREELVRSRDALLRNLEA